MACRYFFANLREHRGRYYEDDIVEKSPIDIYTDDNSRTEFRTSKAEIIKSCDIVKGKMYTKPCRKTDLSIEAKVLLNLWLRKVFENCSRDFIKVSQSTVSNGLQAFTDCLTNKCVMFNEFLTNKAKQLIYMPRNRAEKEV